MALELPRSSALPDILGLLPKLAWQVPETGADLVLLSVEHVAHR